MHLNEYQSSDNTSELTNKQNMENSEGGSYDKYFERI